MFQPPVDAVDAIRPVDVAHALKIEQQFVRTSRPLYAHLVTLLEGAIARGELPSGSRLPPERELASRLRISRYDRRQRVS